MTGKKGYFISIGGGENQLPLIYAVKKSGYRLIVIDRNSKAPGFKEADIKIIESVTEYRRIFNYILKTLLDAPIVGIGCRSFGRAGISAAYLSEKLKLHGNSVHSVKFFQNKFQYKKQLQAKGIPIPEQHSLQDLKKGNIGFPAVIKPSQGEGKKGIRLCRTKKELDAAISQNPEELYAETFIEGREYTVLGFVHQGEFMLVSVSDKITDSKAPFIELVHRLPVSDPRFIGEFVFLCQRTVQIAGLQNGPFTAEFKVNSRSEVFLIEAVPEIGGEFLADSLIPAVLDYDYFGNYVSLMTGKKPEKPVQKYKLKESGYIRFYGPTKEKAFYLGSAVAPNGKIFLEKELKKTGDLLYPSAGNSCRFYALGFMDSDYKLQNISVEKDSYLEPKFDS